MHADVDECMGTASLSCLSCDPVHADLDKCMGTASWSCLSCDPMQMWMSAWEVTGAMRKLTVSTIEGATAAHVAQATKATDIPHAEVCVYV